MSPIRVDVGLNRPGQLLCDFCASEAPVCYYPAAEFEIRGPGGSWASGDRWYACTGCRQLIDRDAWEQLEIRCQVAPQVVELVWPRFRKHRSGPAVEVPAGTNPEHHR